MSFTGLLSRALGPETRWETPEGLWWRHIEISPTPTLSHVGSDEVSVLKFKVLCAWVNCPNHYYIYLHLFKLLNILVIIIGSSLNFRNLNLHYNRLKICFIYFTLIIRNLKQYTYWKYRTLRATLYFNQFENIVYWRNNLVTLFQFTVQLVMNIDWGFIQILI